MLDIRYALVTPWLPIGISIPQIGGNLKTVIRLATILASILLLSSSCISQAPAGAPAGTTALCNDGTYFTGATKSGACRGHKGIKTWYGTSSGATSKASAASTKPTAPATTAASASSAQSKTTSSAPSTSTAKTTSNANPPQPGGGAGQVWVNTASNVYHCPGTQYYGKTKQGAYMSEADAKAKGARPDHGKPCSTK